MHAAGVAAGAPCSLAWRLLKTAVMRPFSFCETPASRAASPVSFESSSRASSRCTYHGHVSYVSAVCSGRSGQFTAGTQRHYSAGDFCQPDTDNRLARDSDTLIGLIPIFRFSARRQSRRTMRKTFYAILSAAMTLVAPLVGLAEATAEYSVQVSANVKASPAQITLSWPQDSISTPKHYVVYRRAPGASTWGTGTTLPGSSTTYVDNKVTTGVPYEYQIVKDASGYPGYGYIYSGIDVPLTENRGILLLLVDDTYAVQLDKELTRLQQDLVGDGWTVSRLNVK